MTKVTSAKLNTTGDVDIFLIEHETNPHPEATLSSDTPGRFMNVSINNPYAVSWHIYIGVLHTDEEVADLDKSTFIL